MADKIGQLTSLSRSLLAATRAVGDMAHAEADGHTEDAKLHARVAEAAINAARSQLSRWWLDRSGAVETSSGVFAQNVTDALTIEAMRRGA